MYESKEKETIFKRTVGRFTVHAYKVVDEYGLSELDYLGEYSDFKEPVKASQKLVHRDSRSVLDHNGHWRDEDGRFVEEPQESWNAREFQYTWHDNGHEKGKHAIHDSKRLDQFNEGYLCVYGVCAEVVCGNALIGEDALWGVESDSDDSYFASTARDVAHEAIKVARDWVEENFPGVPKKDNRRCFPLIHKVSEALFGAASKWWKISRFTEVDRGNYNCPLCRATEYMAEPCYGCPIYAMTGAIACRETPWREFSLPEKRLLSLNYVPGLIPQLFIDDVEYNKAKMDYVKAATAELDFIMGLIPYGVVNQETVVEHLNNMGAKYGRVINVITEALLLEHLPHGSGIDSDWQVYDSESSTDEGYMGCFNSFHCMNDVGFYVGWIDFVAKVPKDDPLSFTLELDKFDCEMVVGETALPDDADEDEYAGPYDVDGLREYLEDTIMYSMEEMVKEWKSE